MFRHRGKGRSYRHNLKLASVLSCVAGFVNIFGLLYLRTLTTNVTGHFAYFSEALFFKDPVTALRYLYYILLFLAGAFTCGLLMNLASKQKFLIYHGIPVMAEALLLFVVASSNAIAPASIAYLLLFAMGLQNALVTRVSQSVVRTTHLTGLFTDLGIELSQLLTRLKGADKDPQLIKNILLRSAIISCFLIGSIAGGFCCLHFGKLALLIPGFTLLFALWYDLLLFRFYRIKRKLKAKK